MDSINSSMEPSSPFPNEYSLKLAEFERVNSNTQDLPSLPDTNDSETDLASFLLASESEASQKTVHSFTTNVLCNPCQETFPTRDEFLIHLEQVHGIYNCKPCNARFECLSSYQNHLELHHSSIPSTLSSTNNVETISYMDSSDDEFYDASETSFYSTQATPDQHDLNYYCSSCIYKFPTRASYYAHLTIIHQFDIPLSTNEPEIRHVVNIPDINCSFNYCNICEFTFVRELDFKNHLVRTHDINLFLADYSPQIIHPAKTPNINNVHFFCSACEYTFLSKHAYSEHLSTVHNLKNMNRSNQVNLSSSEEAPDQLGSSTDVSNNDTDSSNNTKQVHSPVVKTEEFDQFDLSRNTNHNQQHFTPVDQKYESIESDALSTTRCNVCNPLYSGTLLCKSHLDQLPTLKPTRKPNTTQRNHCDLCNLKCPTLIAYEVHMLNVHSIETKPTNKIACEVCKREFIKKGHLTNHIKAKHKELPIKKPNIDINTNTTKDPEIFNCNQCKKKFVRKGALYNHVKNKHSTLSNKKSDAVPDINNPFNHCDACDKTFLSKNSFGIHLQTTHRIKLPRLYYSTKASS